MIATICRWLLLRLIHRIRSTPVMRWHRIPVTGFDGTFFFWRYEPFWYDEHVRARDGKHFNRPPWWRPFNVLLHHWKPAGESAEGMHDHPRWSITVCLRGKINEHTPWGVNVLTPGSIVFRSRKYIHGVSIPKEHSGKTWTLFIVGRRNHPQNTYVVTPQ